jgi:MbtH protein
VTDPFENESASHLVLVNHSGQHSLWPEVIDVPSGWRVVFSSGKRQECVDYIEANWVNAMPGSQPAQQDAL